VTSTDVVPEREVSDPEPERNEPTPVRAPSSARWSRVLVGVVSAIVAVGMVFWLGVVFLGAAPPTTVSANHPKALKFADPWLKQNWALFAPNPVLVDTDIQARARSSSGEVSEWVSFTDTDYAGVRHHLWPSRQDQIELPRAWYTYAAFLAIPGAAQAPPAQILQQYLRNVAVARLAASGAVHGDIAAVQLEVRTTPMPAPTGANAAAANPGGATQQQKPTDTTVDWWPVPAGLEVSR
jgi:Family of unknown function (DUF5819)